MDLSLDPGRASGLTSRSQAARKITEAWASENLYCPSCAWDSLDSTTPGTKVVDFQCPRCEEAFQLKSRSQAFGPKVLDSAYEPMVRSVDMGSAPNLLLLHYDLMNWRVLDLFLIPRYFLSRSAIEKRRPLGSMARRAGWVGCNILLSSLPSDARICLVNDGVEVPPHLVRHAWRSFAFLEKASPESRGWTTDVLACIRDLKKLEFSLREVYSFEDYLTRLHVPNRNVRPKIRQQLQILRDRGILEFLGRGEYRLLISLAQDAHSE